MSLAVAVDLHKASAVLSAFNMETANCCHHDTCNCCRHTTIQPEIDMVAGAARPKERAGLATSFLKVVSALKR